MKQIAVFLSGGGSNARNLVQYFEGSEWARVAVLLTNAPNAQMTQFAQEHGIPQVVLSAADCRDGALLVRLMAQYEVAYIALAGYLKMIPSALIAAFPAQIVNIHPSLLPNFGGKGMYGLRVHEAAIAAGATVSGITIHLVNEIYDDGEILFQDSLDIDPAWTAEELQRQVLVLEHRHYPQVLERRIKEG